MSTVARPKENYPANSEPDGRGILDYLRPFATNTIGGKLIVALTGLALTGFVIIHLIGNLKIYAGRDSLNTYAKFLHDLGPLLWAVRIGLLAVFAAHVAIVLKLKAQSKAARPIGYSYQKIVQASPQSRYMLLTGLVVLFFLLYHLAHFTFGWIQNTDLVDSQGRKDVYAMVVNGFQNVGISVFYILAQLFLFLHLTHGIQSAFQTLGANSPRWQRTLRAVGLAVALFLLVGNVSIPVAVLTGWVS